MLSFVMIVGLLGGMKLDVRAEEQVIDTVEIKVKDPVPGQSFPGVNDVSVITPAGEIEVTEVEWWKNGTQVLQGTVEYNTKYMVAVWMKAKENYKFSKNPKIIINDSSEHISWYRFEDYKGIRATHDFQATAPDPAKTINSIDINIDLPVGGQPFPSEVPSLSNATGMIEWMNQGGVRVSGLAEYDTKYIAQIEYEAKNGYVFADNVTASVNGEPASFMIIEGTNNKNCLITRTFQTAKEGQAQTISNIAITAPEPVGGQKLPYFPDVTYETTEVRGTGINWYKGTSVSDANAASGTAEYNTVYTMRIRYDARDGYIFGSDTTASVNGQPEKCELGTDKKVCYVTYTFPATGAEPSGGDYKIIEGNNSNYVPGSNKPLSFRGDGDYDKFLRVEVDGSKVEKTNYTVREGSTIITFKPNYLATLSNGTHTVEMFWNINGAVKSAAASFHIGEKSGEVVHGNTGTTQPADNTESEPRHVCSFEWVIALDPTTGADGLEEYKCTGCGVVQESHPIPASVAVVKDFYGKVKEAPEKGSITYDSGKLYTISDYILKKMAERNDVAVTVKFEYQNKKYQIIFPVGLDYSAVLNDEESMYGYFGAAARLGLKVTGQ